MDMATRLMYPCNENARTRHKMHFLFYFDQGSEHLLDKPNYESNSQYLFSVGQERDTLWHAGDMLGH